MGLEGALTGKEATAHAQAELHVSDFIQEKKFWKFLYLGADVCYKQQHTPKHCVHRATREREEYEQHRKWAICG